MNSNVNATALFALAIAILLGGVPVEANERDSIWKAVHENDFRKPGDSSRDAARNPEAFLRFLGVTDTMAIGEVNPGGGWYSRVLATLLKERGQYIGLEHHPDIYANYVNFSATLRAYPEKMEVDRGYYGNAAIGTWIPSPSGLPVPEESLDGIIAVRALHNWVRMDFFDEALSQSWRMLKPGGVLGIVQHRADESYMADRRATAERGRWKQSDLVAAIESGGFKLVSSSEMNANPKDTKDYLHGVWTLPPRFALGDEDREKYVAIGESDRMTLKFIKVDRGQ